MTVTWAQVHAGDTVRGADQRPWKVDERHAGPSWRGGGGDTGRFVLSHEGRSLSIMRRLDEPVDRLHVYDHSGEHFAAAALLNAGFELTIISEETVSTPAVADPFTPAAPPQPNGHKRGDAPTGKWGWYKLPHPVTGEADKLWPRVSTIAKTIVDTYGLDEWKLRMVAKGVAVSPDLVAKAAALDPDVDKRDFADVVKAAMERAESGRGANFGTAMHKFAERLDAGETIAAMRVPAELVRDVEAYAAALKAAGLRVLPELSERVVVNAELEYAGRWDRVVVDREGVLRVLDLKTGKDVVEYGGLEFGIGQALYVNATYMTRPDFTGYEPMPALDRMKSFILHLPIGAGQGQVYGLDVNEGWYDARLALTVRARRTAARNGRMWAYSPGTPADAVKLRIGRSVALDELGAAVGDAQRMKVWTPELEALALARYDLIRVSTATERAQLADLWDELFPVGRWTEEVDKAAQCCIDQLKGQPQPSS